MSKDCDCKNCGDQGLTVFYEQKDVPVHSVLLLPTREAAINYPKGNIMLGFCQKCGFISNVAFDPNVHEYSSNYEETQGFSPTFNKFHRLLATHLIERYDLHNKDIIEIGCGKGEFLTLLCELGDNRGIGFDPAYVSERNHSNVKDRTTFIKDFYSEKYSNYRGDFIVCKMTLEHIQIPFDFVSRIRRSIGDQLNTIVFFQVPDVTRVLSDCAFEDIYYEHCSYYSQVSLEHLFSRCDFDVINLWKEYDEQYLMIESKPAKGKAGIEPAQKNGLITLRHQTENFTKKYKQKLYTWQRKLQGIRQNGRRVILWGGGSKGVAFLTTLKIFDEIKYVVDINPFKHGTYMAGTGQKIVGPDFLKEYKPDTVIVMNPIYCEEIRQNLNRMGLTSEIMTV